MSIYLTMQQLLDNRAIIEIKGNGALSFLQNLVTQDLKNNNDYYYSYMLNSQGRYLFDFFIFKANPEHLFIDIAKTASLNFITKLNFYKLRALFEINDVTSLYKIIYSKNLLNSAIYSRADPRYNLLGVRSMIHIDNMQNVVNTEGLYIKDKYNYTIPDGDIDLIYERSIIMEFGAKELGAISYTKGCYMGQELVARTEYQGLIRKKVFKVQSDNYLDGFAGCEIYNNEAKKIGICCSAYQDQAIALIRLEEDEKELADKQFFLKDETVNLSIPSWRI